MSGWKTESGVALVAALLAMTLLVALGTALALTAAAETQIAGTYRAASEALYAADAAIELVTGEVSALPDWGVLFAGGARSRFVDGPPSGVRSTPAGPLDLARAADNPGWSLFAHGALRDFLGASGSESTTYVIAWVAPAAAGRTDLVAVQAHAHARGGVRRAVEVRLARDGEAVRRLSWREVR